MLRQELETRLRDATDRAEREVGLALVSRPKEDVSTGQVKAATS